MPKEMTPAEMLEAAMAGELSLDGEEVTEQPVESTEEPKEDQPTEQVAQEPANEPAAGDEEHPEGAPIASRSGTYTIPYEELTKARDRTRAAEDQVKQLQQQFQELTAKQQANLDQAQASSQAREDAGVAPTAADANLQAAQNAISQGVDVDIFGDFSEQAIANGIAKLQQQFAQQIREELRQEFRQEVAPLMQRHQHDNRDTHYGAIYGKHPDADEIVQSEQFAGWAGSLPSIMRTAVEAALKDGTTDQVIEVFDTFKAATQQQPAKATPAKPALEVQRKLPASLSEIAGEPHRDLVQQTLSAADNPASLLERMSDMTPEQIERVMNAA